jgi:hypothetical protein
MRVALVRPARLGGRLFFGDPILPDETRAPSPVPFRFYLSDRGLRRHTVEGLAKRGFLREMPPIDLRVYFEVGRGHGGRAAYADPTSPWFNVFLGSYEVRVPRAAGTPFAYGDADGSLCPRTILRLGLADWGWLSSYMAGCLPPFEVEAAPTAPIAEPVGATTHVWLGDARWQTATWVARGVPAPVAARWRSPFVPAWRAAFGGAFPGAGAVGPPVVDMTAFFYARAYGSRSHWHTLVSGGSVSHLVPPAEREDLLERQRGGIVRHVTRYWGRG